MNQMFVVIIVIIFMILFCKQNNENFYFHTPSLSYDAETCGRMCDNTKGCNSYFYDPITRACHMQNYFKYGDLYYPYANSTYFWTPSKFRFGKFMHPKKIYHNK
jgi:hypothetical protein